jgi:hypothetical protein
MSAIYGVLLNAKANVFLTTTHLQLLKMLMSVDTKDPACDSAAGNIFLLTEWSRHCGLDPSTLTLGWPCWSACLNVRHSSLPYESRPA